MKYSISTLPMAALALTTALFLFAYDAKAVGDILAPTEVKAQLICRDVTEDQANNVTLEFKWYIGRRLVDSSSISYLPGQAPSSLPQICIDEAEVLCRYAQSNYHDLAPSFVAIWGNVIRLNIPCEPGLAAPLND